MNIKINFDNNFYNIDEDSLILDNKMCYQFIKIQTNYKTPSPIHMPKKMFKQYKSDSLIYTDDSLRELAKQRFFGDCDLYRFDIKKIIEVGYEIYSDCI